ncbi:MAG: carboxypeptidase regulatory-like domain-containing protein, partial [Nitrosopumilus sp.]|nr:carboxypeptidase regulatory-like domain-containing protein [Nitrosopumilus sp.]
MYRSKIIVTGLFAFLMIFSFIPTSQAELWEFIVVASVENVAVYSGDTVVVTGRVVDHAYESYSGIEVLIRAGSDTTKTFTTHDGHFRGEFENFERIPGTYIVNVVASWYGMTGMTSTEFQVKGDATPVSALQQKLSTEEAINYLSANESDFEKNPIGQTLFKYYHGLLDELIEEQKAALEPNEEQMFIEEQRVIAEALRNQDIEEYDPGYGTYEGFKYENYIAGLNPEIKDLVIEQLNFTKNSFLDAQNLKEEMLANGSTYDEAMQAYFEILSFPKATIDQFNEKYLKESTEET